MNVDIIRKQDTTFNGIEIPFLSHEEFKCKCENIDCTFTLANHRILNTFAIIRKHWGSPIGVTSGYRCQRHNSDVGGEEDSWHKKGSAIDIFPHNGDLLGLARMCENFFDFIIVYEDNGFLHCQMEE